MFGNSAGCSDESNVGSDAPTTKSNHGDNVSDAVPTVASAPAVAQAAVATTENQVTAGNLGTAGTAQEPAANESAPVTTAATTKPVANAAATNPHTAAATTNPVRSNPPLIRQHHERANQVAANMTGTKDPTFSPPPVVGVDCKAPHTRGNSRRSSTTCTTSQDSIGMASNNTAVPGEMIIHFVCIVYTSITAIAGLFLKTYNPNLDEIGCYIAPYPIDCLNGDNEEVVVECIRGGDYVQLHSFLATYVPGLISCLLLLYFYLSICYTMIQKLRPNRKLIR